MGFAVLHIQKPKGNDSGTTAHIERAVNPANADPQRSHLNREFIDFPDGVETRTQAIQHRIENAGIKRKISHNQVRALQVMLSGTHEDMLHIHDTGKLDEWCRDNIAWLQETFGRDNVISAVLHLDEKTPHIHATVVPIVTGERRKARNKKEENNPAPPETGKRRYRRKSPDAARLCADDVMTRENLERFQDSYAERMGKYGLRRGIKGSDARHITTPQYYRDLYARNEELKENIEFLQEKKQEVNDDVRGWYEQKDEAREKFLNMDKHLHEKQQELSELESRLEISRQEYEPYKAQEELNAIHKYFTMMKEQMRMAELCKQVGLAFKTICRLLSGKTLTAESAKFHSPEHKQRFEAIDVRLKIEQEPDNPDRLHLNLNGQNILDWFQQKYDELKQAVKPHIKPPQPQTQGTKLSGPS